MTRVRSVLLAVAMAVAVMALLAAPATAQTTTTTKEPAGAPKVTTERITSEVVYAEGRTVVLKLANGDIKTITNIPDSTKALIDGKEVGVRDLKPGTTLTATITTTATPVTVRTVTVGTGTVWHVAGPVVILTMPNGENKQFTVKPGYKFTVNGKPAELSELRAGMVVSGEKIVEEPKVEITSNTQIVGQAPKR